MTPPANGNRPTRSRVHAGDVGAEAPRLHLDTYHVLRRAPWSALIASLVSLFFASNLAFAGLYWLGRPCVANARPDSFADLFFFSVHTMATIGYGTMHPTTLYANVVATFEAAFGLTLTALSVGVVFTKFSQPRPRVQFSKHMVMNRVEGQTRLALRIANGRATAVVDAEISMTLLVDAVDDAGRYVRRMRNLPLFIAHAPLLALTFLAEHRVTEDSPLRQETAQSLLEKRAQVVVAISGLDEHIMQVVHARYVYEATDILEGQRFADVLSRSASGELVVDYRRFHDVEPW